MLHTVTDTIEMVADNIDKKRSKRYFRIKKGHLYWYTKEDSDKAQNDLDIKKIEQLEINQDNDKMILIVYKNKLYKLEHNNRDYIQRWYKSLCLVRSKSEEYLNLDRYVDAQVFERVTGKSMFRDFESILKEHAKGIEDERRKEEEEAKRIRDEEIQKEIKTEIESRKKKGNLKVAAKKKLETNENSPSKNSSTGDIKNISESSSPEKEIRLLQERAESTDTLKLEKVNSDFSGTKNKDDNLLEKELPSSIGENYYELNNEMASELTLEKHMTTPVMNNSKV